MWRKKCNFAVAKSRVGRNEPMLSQRIAEIDDMPQNALKRLNYLMVFVKLFADRFGLSEKQAFNYLDAHKGFAFVDKHYEAIHTLDFAYAIADVQEVCRANGGKL